MEHTTLPHYNIRQVGAFPPGPHAGHYHGYFNDIDGLDTNLQFLYSRDLSLWSSKLVVGVDGEYGSTETDQDELDIIRDDSDPILYKYTSYSVIGDNKTLDVTTKMASPYLQFSASPFDRVRITAGGRYDTVTYEVEDKLNAGTADDVSGDKDFSEFTPKVGLTYDFSANTNSFFSYSQGFVVPTTSQLLTSTGANDQLDAEKATNYEVGLRTSFWNRRFDLNVSVYYMDIEDKIVSEGDNWGDQYVNAGKTTHRGVETVFVIRPHEKISLSVSYTYARNEYDTYVTTTSNYNGNTLPRSPDHHINARLTWMPVTGFQAEVEVDDVSSQYADDANEVSYSRPTLVNLRTSYNWQDWSLWAHIINLTDEKYASYVSGEAGDVGYYSGRPLTFFAGLSYTWGS